MGLFELMSAVSPQLGDAAWFLDGVDAPRGQVRFVRAERAALSAAPFLDDRWARRDFAWISLPLADLRVGLPSQAPRLDFVWHVSFCASTLLAACLDAPGRRLALKEPQALMHLAELKRRGRLDVDPALASMAFTLMARRFQPDEAVLIKPSNGANALIPEAAALTEGRMLLLHCDCESFLLSMAGQGVGGFGYVRELFMTLAADGHPAGRWAPNELFKLTDLQLAALVWRMQMDAFEAASQRLGPRARSLDSRRFLQDPEPVLQAVDAFLGPALDREHFRRLLAGPLFSQDAKQPGERFDPAARAAARTRQRAHLGRDLDRVLAWLERSFPRPPRLAPPVDAPATAPTKEAPAAASPEPASLPTGP
jgi:hypothetical protein